MDNQFPYLAMCKLCHRHGRIRFSEQTESPGFLTKQTAWSVLAFCLDQKLISEDEYRKLYAEISGAKFPEESELTVWDDVILIRIGWMHQERQKGVWFSSLYEPCQPEDPKPIPTLSEAVKIQETLNTLRGKI